MGEAFEYLVKKYPGLTLITNDEWDKGNSFVSLYKSVEYFGNTIIVEGDTLISDSNIIKSEIEESTVAGVKFNEEQKEYVLSISNEKVEGYSSPEGIENGFYIVNVYHLLEADSKKYKELLIKNINDKEWRDGYAERALLESSAKIGLQVISSESAIEIDTYKELQAIDPSYK